MKFSSSWILIFLTALLASPAHAVDPEKSKTESNSDGEFSLNFRYRYAFVDQDGFAKDARASTLRTRLAYRSSTHSNFGFLIEFDDVRSIGNDLYNSTRNGNTDRPVVADPEGTVVNQALIYFDGIEDTVLQAGRRRIGFDNHRFIGDVGWRQNDQTYDSFSLINSSLPDTEIEYAYIDRVNRIFGPDSGVPAADFRSDSHVLNVKHQWSKNWDVAAYAYLLDIEDAPLLSSKTLGIRFRGSLALNDRISTRYTMEYARQDNYGDNPNNYSADYILLEAALTAKGITGTLGYEVLGSHSVQAFQTPLATLHAFQGWADKFVVTPAAGIEDFYVSVATAFRGAKVSLIYHRFNPEAGGPVYGSEWDLMIKKILTQRYSIVLKAAFYDAGSFATDTRKLWIMFTARLGN